MRAGLGNPTTSASKLRIYEHSFCGFYSHFIFIIYVRFDKEQANIFFYKKGDRLKKDEGKNRKTSERPLTNQFNIFKLELQTLVQILLYIGY